MYKPEIDLSKQPISNHIEIRHSFNPPDLSCALQDHKISVEIPAGYYVGVIIRTTLRLYA